uniref:Uncharacterized protein n=1 Tax=Physcomitrium patens TaxID=3218 RepID=A0A2K1L949_PHYPA|nr:hypothetical protein PHYPA_000966 [Physcomitrium patens]
MDVKDCSKQLFCKVVVVASQRGEKVDLACGCLSEDVCPGEYTGHSLSYLYACFRQGPEVHWQRRFYTRQPPTAMVRGINTAGLIHLR